MTHLGERITEFVFEELPAGEMSVAKAHVEQCGECRSRVEDFRNMRSLLQSVPDEELPRSAALTFEKPAPQRFWSWKWLAPVTVAVVVLGVALVAPIQIQWQDSQLTIALGSAPKTASPAIEEQQRRIQQLQASLDYLSLLHGQMQRDIYENASSIQLLARRTPPVGD